MREDSDPDLDHILRVCRLAAAAGGPGPLSKGEALVAALVLNRPDWLAAANYTIVEALERIGPEWTRQLPAAAAVLQREGVARIVASEELAKAAMRPAPDAPDAELSYQAKLLSHGHAPGYRSVSLLLELRETGAPPRSPLRARITLPPDAGEPLARLVLDVHRHAWERRRGPLDQAEGEPRPSWTEPGAL